MEGLARKNRVTLFSFYNDEEQLTDLKRAKEICEHVYLWPRSNKYSKNDLLKGIFSDVPFTVYNYWDPMISNKLNDLLIQRHFDVIQIEHAVLAKYAFGLRSLCKVMDFHNLEYEKMERFGEIEKNIIKKKYANLTAKKLKRFEFGIPKRFDLCLTCSDRERFLLKQDAESADVICVPNGTDIYKRIASVVIRPIKYFLFVGALNADKNVDAVLYFCQDVLPRIQKEKPEIVFRVAGGFVPSQVKKLQEQAGVEVLGYVKDLKPLFGPDTLSVVPLRYGGGTRLKILESMALGVPVISTSIGCEGLEVKHESLS